MKRSFYEILGVPHDADQATIDTAYAQATQRVNHNIKMGTADAAMEARLVREGYQMLSEPAKRARYDAKLSAEEHGVQLMFFPDDRGAQRKLGVQSVIFALLATTFVGVLYWQMNRKIGEVRADYESVVVRKAAAQNAPKVVEEVPLAQSGTPGAEATRADSTAPRVSDGASGETVLKLVDAPKSDSIAKAPDSQTKR